MKWSEMTGDSLLDKNKFYMCFYFWFMALKTTKCYIKKAFIYTKILDKFGGSQSISSTTKEKDSFLPGSCFWKNELKFIDALSFNGKNTSFGGLRF